MGSGGHFPTSTDWWIYDGTCGAPRAERMRAACACGWRAQVSYPIDWSQVRRREPYTYDTSPLAQDWKIHIEDVEARTVPLPAELADLLQRLDQHLDRLAEDAPLAALKAVRALETIIATTGPAAAFMTVSGAEIPWSRIAEGLGTTESEARSRLRRYEYPRRP
ncbi:hypothetical protein ACH44C_29330 [Streptomyces purpureus]|uniref:hypothetical protein n=1 Tax=Streptomyces purpureus TaxID=1951 RepID=UPI00378AAB26